MVDIRCVGNIMNSNKSGSPVVNLRSPGNFNDCSHEFGTGSLTDSCRNRVLIDALDESKVVAILNLIINKHKARDGAISGKRDNKVGFANGR